MRETHLCMYIIFGESKIQRDIRVVCLFRSKGFFEPLVIITIIYTSTSIKCVIIDIFHVEHPHPNPILIVYGGPNYAFGIRFTSTNAHARINSLTNLLWLDHMDTKMATHHHPML